MLGQAGAVGRVGPLAARVEKEPIVRLPFDETLAGRAFGPGVERDPPLGRVAAEVLDIDVSVADECLEENRAAVGHLAAQDPGPADVVHAVPQPAFGARFGEEVGHEHEQHDRDDDAQQRGHDRRRLAPRGHRLPLSRRHSLSIPAVQRPYRVVVAKPGLDGHDRGAKVIARALRDAGFEVIYTGLHQTPEQVVEAVIQEDADAVGCSLLSGAHMTLFPRILDLLRERGAEDVLVFGGGIIPDADIPKLKELGVAEIFTPGASMASITEWLEKALDDRESQTA